MASQEKPGAKGSPPKTPSEVIADLRRALIASNAKTDSANAKAAKEKELRLKEEALRLKEEALRLQEKELRLQGEELRFGTYFTPFNNLWKTDGAKFTEDDFNKLVRVDAPVFNMSAFTVTIDAANNDGYVAKDGGSTSRTSQTGVKRSSIWSCHVLNIPPAAPSDNQGAVNILPAQSHNQGAALSNPSNNPPGDIAHLVPASSTHATLYFDVAKWVFGSRNVGEGTPPSTIQKLIHGAGPEKGKRIAYTGLKHMVCNKIRLCGQAVYFDRDPMVLIVPILSIDQVKDWAGEGYSAIFILGEKRGSSKEDVAAVAATTLLSTFSADEKYQATQSQKSKEAKPDATDRQPADLLPLSGPDVAVPPRPPPDAFEDETTTEGGAVEGGVTNATGKRKGKRGKKNNPKRGRDKKVASTYLEGDAPTEDGGSDDFGAAGGGGTTTDAPPEDEIELARILLESFLKGLAFSLSKMDLKRAPFYCTDVPGTENNAEKELREELTRSQRMINTGMVTVPTVQILAKEHTRVAKITFWDQGTTGGHPAPDPMLLATKAAVNWSTFFGFRLLAGGEPQDECDSDDQSAMAELAYLEWAKRLQQEQQEKDILGREIVID